MNFIKLFFFLSATLLFSCDRHKTYAEYLEDEREAISEYISKNNIHVVSSKPEGDGAWLTDDGREIYYKAESGLYFHQVEKGGGDLVPKPGSTVYFRFVGVNMQGNKVYDCTEKYNPNPQSLLLSSVVSANSAFGSGFQEALRQMCAGGHVKIIVPFKIGNGAMKTIYGTGQNDASDYIPMAFEIWLMRVE